MKHSTGVSGSVAHKKTGLAVRRQQKLKHAGGSDVKTNQISSPPLTPSLSVTESQLTGLEFHLYRLRSRTDQPY